MTKWTFSITVWKDRKMKMVSFKKNESDTKKWEKFKPLFQERVSSVGETRGCSILDKTVQNIYAGEKNA